MQWTNQGENIWTGIAEVHTKNEGASKATKKHIAFRVDGRKKPVRVDKKTFSFMPWEAIDDGKGFGSTTLGKRYAESYCKAINAEETLDPRNVERPKARTPSSRLLKNHA